MEPKLFVCCLAAIAPADFANWSSTVSNYVNKPLPTNPSANFATGAAGSDPEGHSGAYGMGTAAANGINTFNSFWIYTTPLCTS
jgi:POT family proton-dependent oligopeptide transporter